MEDEIEIPIVTDYRDILKFLEGIKNGTISQCPHVSAISGIPGQNYTNEPVSARATAFSNTSPGK